jgi:hypothetical protein
LYGRKEIDKSDKKTFICWKYALSYFSLFYEAQCLQLNLIS